MKCIALITAFFTITVSQTEASVCSVLSLKDCSDKEICERSTGGNRFAVERSVRKLFCKPKAVEYVETPKSKTAEIKDKLEKKRACLDDEIRSLKSTRSMDLEKAQNLNKALVQSDVFAACKQLYSESKSAAMLNPVCVTSFSTVGHPNLPLNSLNTDAIDAEISKLAEYQFFLLDEWLDVTGSMEDDDKKRAKEKEECEALLAEK